MDPAAERQRLRVLLQQSEVAMLLTLGTGEAYAGRPMLPLWLPEDPNIYFLTHRESRKLAQVNERPRSRSSRGLLLVVLGLAYASQDPALIRDSHEDDRAMVNNLDFHATHHGPTPQPSCWPTWYCSSRAE
jgi:pyridoxamine 5'-phosphate oxidase like protein